MVRCRKKSDRHARKGYLVNALPKKVECQSENSGFCTFLELMFKKYKCVEGLTETRVQGDHSAYGSESINFITTVITREMIRRAETVGILDGITYGEMMHELDLIWRKSKATEPAKQGDPYWVHPFTSGIDILIKLGFIGPAEDVATNDEPKKEAGQERSLYL